MKKTTCILLLAGLFGFVQLSFKPKRFLVKEVSGVYGVCACDGENGAPVSVSLGLMDDMTYQYIDNSGKTKISETGQWQLKKGNILLKSTSSEQGARTTWKVEKDGKCIKSRKGMAFYRLCNLNLCH